MNEKNILNGEALCQECGLCCQGVFHSYVRLLDDEVCIIEKTNINVQFDKEEKFSFFTLACLAFDGHCSIYQERPSTCSKHRCELLQSVIQEEIEIQDALMIVDKMKFLLDEFLPELKHLCDNKKTNFPPQLMDIIFDSFEEGKTKEEFKKDHKKLFMKIAVFGFLKNKYFYKNEQAKSL